jgi:hypothetical protein
VPDEAIEEEIRGAKELLDEWNGGLAHSFAYPIVRRLEAPNGAKVVPEIVGQSIIRLNEMALAKPVSDQYALARCAVEGPNLLPELDPLHLRCYCADGSDEAALLGIVEEACGAGAWAILVFNGLPDVSFDTSAHEALCRSLSGREDLLVAPVRDIATRLGFA